jgi:hypothetical protein
VAFRRGSRGPRGRCAARCSPIRTIGAFFVKDFGVVKG